MLRDDPRTDTSGTDTSGLDTLRRLVMDQGIATFVPFLVTGEGNFLPNGVEESSGYVLDATGRVFRFWLAWDAEREAPVLSVWRPVESSARWETHPEYVRARETLGLR